MSHCPRCGRPGSAPHACDEAVVAFYRDRPVALALWADLWRRMERHGPVEVAATKSRTSFVRRIRFAWVHEATLKGVHVGFLLPHPLESPRVRSGRRGNVWSHHVKMEGEVDEEVMGWLREAYDAAA